MTKEFSRAVIEKLNYYVYCLIDPRSNEVFYIGKGCGNRVFAHMNLALETSFETDKLDQIRQINKEGLDPIHYIIRHGLEPNHALEIESTLIDYSRLCEGFNFKLKNLVKGHHSFDRGLKTATDIVQFYDAKTINIEEQALIIIVNKLYWYGMPPEELYRIVHEKWRLSRDRINNVKYVIAAYLGLTREVYEVKEWYDTFDERTKKMRVGFNGKVAEENIRNKYLNGSLSNYKSNGSPTIYVNC